MDTILSMAEGIIEYGEEAERIYAKPLAEAIVAEQQTPMRYALVTEEAGKGDQIAAYMPGNYKVLGRTPIRATNRVVFLIGGRDSCGWTLDDYVIPRLASGMYFAEEVA
jgi:hypothetical protein